jgi:hypothetical protein
MVGISKAFKKELTEAQRASIWGCMWLVGQVVVLLVSLVSPTLPLPIRYNGSSATSTKVLKIYSNHSQEAVDLRNSVLEMYDILSVVQFKIVKLLYKPWQHLLSLVITLAADMFAECSRYTIRPEDELVRSHGSVLSIARSES